MKTQRLAPLVAISLVGCAQNGLGLAPANPPVAGERPRAADQTVLDEQAALSVELAYKAARTALEIGAETGLLKGRGAAAAAEADNRAFAAVLAVRAAYRGGNAGDYGKAVAAARATIAALLSLAH
jgi:hypothetical protein